MADQQELLSPEEIRRVQEAAEKAAAIQQQADQVQVRTDEEAEQAMALLAAFSGERRATDDARTFIVKPLNDHVKAINARFKPHIAALEAAERTVKGKVIDWRAEQRRKAEEEQRRLDTERRERERAAEEERRRAEAEARAAREAAAREAARAEEEARKAERARQEEIDKDTASRRARIGRLGDEALRRIAEGGSSDAPMAQEELDGRRKAREAQERAAAAREAEEQARLAEEAARNAPAEQVPATAVAAPAPLAGGGGRGVERRVWQAEVVDEFRVPREYLVVDMKLVNKAVRDGVRRIPGVKIEQVDQLAVRGR